jgi:hypothetical protein
VGIAFNAVAPASEIDPGFGPRSLQNSFHNNDLQGNFPKIAQNSLVKPPAPSKFANSNNPKKIQTKKVCLFALRHLIS